MEKVIIEVSGGVATVVSCPDNVEVEIRDLDTEWWVDGEKLG
jgi:hypothetical protein